MYKSAPRIHFTDFASAFVKIGKSQRPLFPCGLSSEAESVSQSNSLHIFHFLARGKNPFGRCLRFIENKFAVQHEQGLGWHRTDVPFTRNHTWIGIIEDIEYFWDLIAVNFQKWSGLSSVCSEGTNRPLAVNCVTVASAQVDGGLTRKQLIPRCFFLP